MDEKKFVSVGKEMYSVENGRVYIESEELANAIQDGEVDLFLDEEASNLINSNCNGCNPGCDK